jgi:hypothetical protein
MRKIYYPSWESKLHSTFCLFHLTTLSVAPAYAVSSGGMISELEVTQKDVATAGFQALVQHLLARTE